MYTACPAHTLHVKGLSFSGITLPDGSLWFRAADVCHALGFSSHLYAVSRHVLDEDRINLVVMTPGGPQEVLHVSEPGLYSLILRCRLPAAQPFKRWLSSEVLETVLRDGLYVNPDATPEQLDVLAQRCEELASAKRTGEEAK